MKILFILFLFAVNSLAADFSPTPMTISVQPQLEYKFDGSPLEIPFTLTGKSGAIWLVINTHGQADNIVGVRNGHLGWHYVNKIDTTIYISQKFERQPGENTIVWDGRDENGNKAEPGSYDYYLWGYDDKSSRELACNFIQIGYSRFNQSSRIYEKDQNGLPLSNPMIMGNNFIWSRDSGEAYKRTGTHYKWDIGNNPNDISMIQTTMCSIYYPKKSNIGEPDFICYSDPVLNPENENIFYHTVVKNIPKESASGTYYLSYSSIFKWNFVPGGEAILDQNWLGFDNKMWLNSGASNINYSRLYNDSNYLYITPPPHLGNNFEDNRIICIDYSGDIIFDKLMHEWYMPEYWRMNSNCSIEKFYTRNPNKWLISSTFCCMHQMINTSRLIEDQEDETDMVLFTNSNGDYFMDNGWQSNIEYPWFCLPHYNVSYENTIVKNSICIDSNNFNIFFIGNYGISSFGVSTQDGTGIGYMNFADDVPDSRLGEKGGGQLCDSGSAYDGLYIHGKTDPVKHWTEFAQTYYIAFDSAHGLITNNPAVETQNPIQFKVSQNTPNPFNPSTSISFSIPEKSTVTIDIYNITGQKIKTLINGSMSAGEHSVKWDAGGCSAGVYFYKVRAGKYEKTMRMTLVK